MANITGTNIAAAIVPFTEEDKFPTHEDIYGKGGYRTVSTLAQRNTIPIERRKLLMSVAVEENTKVYRLNINPITDTTLDTDWEDITTVKGEKGDPGIQGPQGIEGPAGAVGPAVTIEGTVPSLTVLNTIPGDITKAYIVTDDGLGHTGALYMYDGINSVYYYIGNIQGPQGIQGIQGQKGDPGLQGEKGIQGIQGEQGEPGEAADSTFLNKLWNLKWNIPFIITNASDEFTSPIIPLGRDGTLEKINFYCVGTPSVATTVNINKNGASIGSISISVTGITTYTLNMDCSEDDQFQYIITGAGLSACSLTINQKWINR